MKRGGKKQGDGDDGESGELKGMMQRAMQEAQEEMDEDEEGGSETGSGGGDDSEDSGKQNIHAVMAQSVTKNFAFHFVGSSQTICHAEFLFSD